MCKHRDTVQVIVRDEPNGETRSTSIDRCIAPMVEAFQKNNIITVDSCCGHYLWDGYILMYDGTCIPIWKKDGYERYLEFFNPLGRFWANYEPTLRIEDSMAKGLSINYWKRIWPKSLKEKYGSLKLMVVGLVGSFISQDPETSRRRLLFWWKK